MTAVLPVFEEAGCRLQTGAGEILLEAPPRLERVRMVRTMPYPGFCTDAQSPVMAMACGARGTSIFVETIFESRYKQVDELARMGARIKVEGRVAVVEGVEKLHSASMRCTDLRGGASLVVAALGRRGNQRHPGNPPHRPGIRGSGPAFAIDRRGDHPPAAGGTRTPRIK